MKIMSYSPICNQNQNEYIREKDAAKIGIGYFVTDWPFADSFVAVRSVIKYGLIEPALKECYDDLIYVITQHS